MINRSIRALGLIVTAVSVVAPTAQLHANDDAIDSIMLGRSFFTLPWVAAPASTTARDGLGPLFNANGCSVCHRDNGSADTVAEDGTPRPALLFKLARRPDDTPRGDPVYGEQIAINATGRVAPEARTTLSIETSVFTYPDGQSIGLQRLQPGLDALAYGPLAVDTVLYVRQPNILAGLGLLEQVSDAAILSWQDPLDADGDGISGRGNILASGALGRFGWKASQPGVREQVATAAAIDMGLTSSLYPDEACQPAQRACRAAPTGRAGPSQVSGAVHDLTDQRLQAISDYVTSLPAPPHTPLDADATLGANVFEDIGCAACHRASLPLPQGGDVHPMSDLLLHDMGEALSDGVRVHGAEGAEFRTAPLWGLGARQRAGHRFLHDARARLPEEAILWHGGEAGPSRDRFVHLDARSRSAILHYLTSL